MNELETTATLAYAKQRVFCCARLAPTNTTLYLRVRVDTDFVRVRELMFTCLTIRARIFVRCVDTALGWSTGRDLPLRRRLHQSRRPLLIHAYRVYLTVWCVLIGSINCLRKIGNRTSTHLGLGRFCFLCQSPSWHNIMASQV